MQTDTLYRVLLIREWTDVQPSSKDNQQLGLVLTLVAGAAQAGGFLAMGNTAHVQHRVRDGR